VFSRLSRPFYRAPGVLSRYFEASVRGLFLRSLRTGETTFARTLQSSEEGTLNEGYGSAAVRKTLPSLFKPGSSSLRTSGVSSSWSVPGLESRSHEGVLYYSGGEGSAVCLIVSRLRAALGKLKKETPPCKLKVASLNLGRSPCRLRESWS